MKQQNQSIIARILPITNMALTAMFVAIMASFLFACAERSLVSDNSIAKNNGDDNSDGNNGDNGDKNNSDSADGNNGDSGDGNNGGDGDKKLAYLGKEAQSANGVVLGDLISGGSYVLTVLTTNDYIVNISWNGNLHGFYPIYANNPDDASTYFNIAYSNNPPYGKTVIADARNNNLYTHRNLDANGYPIADSSITHYKYSISQGGVIDYSTINNGDGIELGTQTALPLKPVTRDEVGLPAVIEGPLKLVNKTN